MSKFEYADDAALIDADAATATARVTALAVGSITGATQYNVMHHGDKNYPRRRNSDFKPG